MNLELFKDIQTDEEIQQFVKNLNELPHQKKYQLFMSFPEDKIKIVDLICKDYPKLFNGKLFNGVFRKWMFRINKYWIYITVKVNYDLPVEFPELKTGFHELYFFHFDPEDKSGISQINL